MRLTWNTALEETEMVLFETVHKLFKTTGVSPQDVRLHGLIESPLHSGLRCACFAEHLSLGVCAWRCASLEWCSHCTPHGAQSG